MKYRYFKFPNNGDECIARVIQKNKFYEYKTLKRKDGKAFGWDDDWLDYWPRFNGHDFDCYKMMVEHPDFTLMSDEEVFAELL